MDLDAANVKLTDLASCGGCAAKYSAARLEQLLAGFVPVEAENLLVGLGTPDDAAVYRLDDERAIIFTLDFFPPIVDDPGDYGSIAATNALNDVFAMGGTPLLALSIAAFPEELPMEMLGADLRRGATRPCARPGAMLVGGHTIRDAEPKYGLAVVGMVHPTGRLDEGGAQPGDALYVTKPLGTGLIMTGHKRGHVGTQQLERAVGWMKTLNKDAADVLRPLKVERRHRRDRLRPLRARARDGGAKRRPDPARVGALPGDRRRARHRAQEAFARAAIRATETSPAATHAQGRAGHARRCSGTTRRPRAGCSFRCPPSAAPVLEAEFAARHLFLRRIGRGRRGLRRLRRLGPRREARDDPRAVPAVPPRPSRVHARSRGALRRALGRDHEPRPGAREARGERPGAAPAGVEPVHVRRAAADGEGGRRRPRARSRSACM